MANPLPNTFPDLLRHAAESHGGKVCLRRRHGTGGDPVSYTELHQDVRTLAQGLLAHGITHGDRIGILAENSYAWLLADLAITHIGAIDVPRGADTSPHELRHILAHSGSRMAFAENDKVAQEILNIQDQLPELEDVCILGDETDIEGVLTFADLRSKGAASDIDLDAAIREVCPSDVLTIVYTSGTTADPKGVVLTHQNVLSNAHSINQILGVGPQDIFLSVLPAWHVYERIIDYLCLSCGGELVYTSRRKIKEDLRVVQPTVFAAVPRIWENIHDGIVSHCNKLTGFKKRLMNSALESSRAVARRDASLLTRLKHKIYSKILLPKILQTTGGRMRIAVSGGGALPTHVDELLLGIGLPILNGYGLTETSPVVCLRPPDDRRVNSIGPVLANTEVEIRDFDGHVLPTGEIGLLWVKGPQVMRGYYNNPETTAKVLSQDGWFNSGDLARRDADGHHYITGRAKDTIVLAGGENVEPEPVETGIKASDVVEQAVVLGQDKKSLGAILIPRPDNLERAIPRAEWGEKDGELTGEKVITLMRQTLDQTLTREAGFRPCERVSRFRVRLEPMTIENGLLTPTMKVKRHEVQEQMSELIDDLFD